MKRILNSCGTHVARISFLFYFIQVFHDRLFSPSEFSESLESNQEIKIYQSKHTFLAFP